MFQLSQLRCFVAVASELHFGRAAALLNMTQPPLSRQIQLLERELKAQLLERAGGVVRLTLAGRGFLPEAEDILRRAEAAMRGAQRATRPNVGSVRLGFIPAVSYQLLPRLVELTRRQLPEVDIAMREMQTPDQVEALGAGSLDLAIIRPYAPRPFAAFTPLLREPFVLALPAGHALSRKRAVPLKALEGRPFIEYSAPESRYLYEIVAGRLRAEGVRLDVVHSLSHTHSLLALVSTGMGVALVPRSAMSLRYKGVSYRPLDCFPALEVEMHLAWRPHKGQQVADVLRELMLKAFGPASG